MILVFNAGSSSLKYALFEGERCVARKTVSTEDVAAEAKRIIDSIDTSAIDCIAHRIVHGGKHTHAEIITPEVEKNILKQIPLAPLHNPYELKIVEECKPLGLPQVAVYDTGFFTGLPEKVTTFPLPRKLTQEHDLKKIGYHGISHEFLLEELAQAAGKPKHQVSCITCHLGSGCSVACIEQGRPKDVSIEFSTIGGLMMVTRAGNIDPGALLYLIDEAGLSTQELKQILEHESGIKGLSGSKDVKTLIEKNDESIDIFSYHVAKYIAMFHGLLKSCDGIVFAGGIAQKSPVVRRKICEELKGLGIEIDEVLNKKNATIISSKGPQVWVLATNEELMIARKASELIAK